MLVLLMVFQFLLGRENQRLTRLQIKMQNGIASSQRAEPVLNQLAIRLALAAQNEPDLKDLLTKYKLRVRLQKQQPEQAPQILNQEIPE